jgi:hypothetical protein
LGSRCWWITVLALQVILLLNWLPKAQLMAIKLFYWDRVMLAAAG